MNLKKPTQFQFAQFHLVLYKRGKYGVLCDYNVTNMLLFFFQFRQKLQFLF